MTFASGVSSSRLELVIDSRGAEQALKRTERGLEGVERAGNRASGQMDRINTDMQRIRGYALAASGALAGLAGALSAREVIQMSDAWNNAANQLRRVTDSSSELEAMQKRLVAVSVDTRSNFESTANLYSRLARSTTELGVTQEDLIGLTRTINQSFAVSGSTAGEAAAAITQLSQGLAAGALRGDEFNSVAEQAPGIMRAIAESLEMGIGELREFAAEGGITAEIVVNALQDASATIDQEFGESVASFGQKMAVAQTRLLEWVGTSDEAGAAVDVFGDAIVGLSKNIDTIANAASGLALVVGGRLVSSLAASTTAMVAKTAAGIADAKAEAAAAQQTARRAAAELQAAKTVQARAIADGKATAGTNAHAFAMQGLTAATTRATAAQASYTSAANVAAAASGRASIAARGAAGALALIGGPAGAAVLAGGAIYYFREELGLVPPAVRSASDELDTLRTRLNDVSEATIKYSVAGFTAELFQLQVQAQQASERLETLKEAQRSPNSYGQGMRGDLSAGIADQEAELESLNNQIEARQQAVEQLTGKMAELNTTASDGSSIFRTLDGWLFDVAETSGSTSAAIADTTSELDRQAESAQGLLDELYPLQASQRQYAEDKAQLVQYALRENKGNEWLAESMRRLDESYRSNQTAAEAYGLEVDNLADRADPMADAFQEATRRIDETFADAFQGAFDSFDDFASQLEDAFKRLLAELAYQATLRPIVVGFTSDMQGALGIGGAQSQGLSGTISGLNSVLGGADKLFGTNIQGGITSALGIGSSTATYAGFGAAGGYGGWAGSAAAGAASSGGMMGAIGSAMPWIGAGLLADNLLGLGITDSIVGGISDLLGGLFGGDSDLDIAMMRRESRNSGRSWDHGIVAEGALGAVGFDDDGSHEVADLWDIDEAKELVEGIAQLDTAIASLASNQGELDAMREAVLSSNRHGIQGHYGETSNPGDVVDRLTSRYDQVLDQIGGDFGRFVRGLDGDIEEVIEEGLRARDAFGVMSAAAEVLDLRFRTAGTSGYRAASALAEIVGGAENLATLQQQYASTFMTQGERVQQLQGELEDQFDDLGLAMPSTIDGFRDLVEAQNLMTQAGRGQYAALLQLVPTMSQYLDVMDRQHSQLQDWIDSLLLSDQSTLDPSERLQESQSQYASLLVQAENGDTDAMGSLGNVAQQYLAEAASYYGQASGQYGSIFDEILDAARGLGVEIDGSHAAGLGTVPFDGYRAELHRGETVLPAPIAQLYRDSAPGGSSDGEMLRTMQAMHQEMTRLRNEVRQLRGERGEDAARAASQRDRQLRAQEGIDRNTRTPVTPL